MSHSFTTGESAAVYLGYGGSDQSIIAGLNSIKLPDKTRQVVEVSEFGEDFDVDVTTSGKTGSLSFSGNRAIKDTKGQDQLNTYIDNNTKFNDARIYLSTVTHHFLAPDLANDSASGFRVSKVAGGTVAKKGLIDYSTEWAVGGRLALFDTHDVTSGTNLAFVADAGSGATITDTGSGFVTAGFVAGQTLIIEGSTSNDGQYIIESVAAGVITLTDDYDLTAEAALATTYLHGGKA